MTHLLKLLDNVCNYEMDLEYCKRHRADTIRSTDRQTDRWTDRQGETSITPFNFVEHGYDYSRTLLQTGDIIQNSHQNYMKSHGIYSIKTAQYTVLVANYGISNTTVLEIPQFTTKTALCHSNGGLPVVIHHFKNQLPSTKQTYNVEGTEENSCSIYMSLFVKYAKIYTVAQHLNIKRNPCGKAGILCKDKKLHLRASDDHVIAISQEIHQPSLIKFSLKMTHIKFHLNLPGVNDIFVFNNSTRACTSNYILQETMEWNQLFMFLCDIH